jgi:uncharacterized protein involved in exopolysaccharide biosynthesis
LFTSLALAYAFLSPKIYKTETTLVPLSGSEGGGLSSLAGLLGVSIGGNKPQLTVQAVLESRTLKERIIKDLNLMPLLFPKEWDNKTKRWKNPEEAPTIIDGIKELDKLISVSTDRKTGIITFSVEFPENPQMPYKISLTALNETRKILNEKAWSLAKKYRIFLENQIKEVLKRLNQLEDIYKKFLEGKIKEVPIVVDTAFIESISHKAGALISEEKEKGNKEKEIKQEIFKLQKTLSNMSKAPPFTSSLGSLSVPQYQFNYQKLQWQLDLLKNVLSTLFQQYEIAKQKEMREEPAFQVLDAPYVPNKPSKPKKLLITVVGFFSGLFLGIFGAFFKEWYENVKRQRENSLKEE